jgi:putative ABC transport system ATP-binding protein
MDFFPDPVYNFFGSTTRITGNKLIEIHDLNVVKKEKPILTDINLTIKTGEKIVIRGESGSGKSTLVKSILFFERFSGSVLFQNRKVGEDNLVEYRSHICYIGQIVPNLDESVRDFFKIPYRYRANRQLEVNQARIRALLPALNFEESVLEKNYRDLSGGEKQRLLIMQTLLLDKPVYIFDEVAASLDEKNVKRAVELITEGKQRTVISISHQTEWEKSSTRVIEMKEGRIVRERSLS